MEEKAIQSLTIVLIVFALFFFIAVTAAAAYNKQITETGIVIGKRFELPTVRIAKSINKDGELITRINFEWRRFYIVLQTGQSGQRMIPVSPQVYGELETGGSVLYTYSLNVASGARSNEKVIKTGEGITRTVAATTPPTPTAVQSAPSRPVCAIRAP